MKFYEIQDKENRIDVFSERWYYVNDKFYRNVTTILGIIHKGYNFDEWLKNNGHNSEIIMDRAGTFGTDFHSLIQKFLLGETVSYYNHQAQGEKYSTALWERFCIWLDFWKELNQKEVSYEQEDCEKIMINKEYGYAGTLDFIATVDGVKTLFDWKSGNHIGNQEKLQMTAYMNMAGIDKAILVHIPAVKPNKKGYRLTEVKYSQEGFDLFIATKKIFDMENRDEPKIKTLPIELSIETLK